MKKMIPFSLLFLSCVYDITGLGNHPVELPEHTLAIVSGVSPYFYAYIFDIDSMEIVDSLCLTYYYKELNDLEFISGVVEKTPQDYLMYSIKFKYAKRYTPGNTVRFLNPKTGRVVKELDVMDYPAIVQHQFYHKGHKYEVIASEYFNGDQNESIVSVCDLTALKCVSDFRLNCFIGNVLQDVDSSVYYLATYKSSPFSSSPDSAFIRRLNLDDFKSYEDVLKIDGDNEIVYNKKIYLFYNSEGLIKVLSLDGKLLAEKRFPYHFRSMNIINGYIIISDGNKWFVKIDPETFEYKAVPLGDSVAYSVNCKEGVAYSKKLDLLFTTNNFLGANIHIYYIDFDNFEIVGEYVDYKRKDGWYLEVIE